ncbi:unnamed protein product, partial [Adineta steineri]
NGKSIGNYSYSSSDEKEVLLLPGTEFLVTGKKRANRDLTIVHLKEIRADDPASYVTKTIEKICGHGCNLWKTRQCCHCSDKRAHKGNGLYEKYVDGIGFVNGASRNEYYCPTCKLHEDLS